MDGKKNLLTGLLLLVASAACFHAAASPQEKTVVTDAAGRTVTVPVPAERIVCVGPGALRLITYLDAADKVVAIESGFEKESPMGRPYRIAHPEWDALPEIGAASPSPAPNPEALLQVNPDVIFISYVEGRIADDLAKKTGVPVIILRYGGPGSFDDGQFFHSLRTAGKILNKEDRAQVVIRFMKDCEEDLKRRTEAIPDDERPEVYVGALGFKGAHGITSTDRAYLPFELLRARNVASGGAAAGHVFIDKEKLLEWDPDIIFIDGGGVEIVRDDYQKDRAFYDLLTAVRNRDVYGLFPYNYYATNIDTALADAYFIGKTIYPERFMDIDPEVKADEIYSFFVGRPVYAVMKKDWGAFNRLDLDERGIPGGR